MRIRSHKNFCCMLTYLSRDCRQVIRMRRRSEKGWVFLAGGREYDFLRFRLFFSSQIYILFQPLGICTSLNCPWRKSLLAQNGYRLVLSDGWLKNPAETFPAQSSCIYIKKNTIVTSQRALLCAPQIIKLLHGHMRMISKISSPY